MRQRRQVIAISEEARNLLRDHEWPAEVRQRLRLLARGGKQQAKRPCLLCGGLPHTIKLYVPSQLLQPVPDTSVEPQVYWVCRHHAAQEPAITEVAQRLVQTRR